MNVFDKKNQFFLLKRMVYYVSLWSNCQKQIKNTNDIQKNIHIFLALFKELYTFMLSDDDDHGLNRLSSIQVDQGQGQEQQGQGQERQGQGQEQQGQGQERQGQGQERQGQGQEQGQESIKTELWDYAVIDVQYFLKEYIKLWLKDLSFMKQNVEQQEIYEMYQIYRYDILSTLYDLLIKLAVLKTKAQDEALNRIRHEIPMDINRLGLATTFQFFPLEKTYQQVLDEFQLFINYKLPIEKLQQIIHTATVLCHVIDSFDLKNVLITADELLAFFTFFIYQSTAIQTFYAQVLYMKIFLIPNEIHKKSGYYLATLSASIEYIMEHFATELSLIRADVIPRI